MTAQETALAEEGRSYAQITMSSGKRFGRDETRRAVDSVVGEGVGGVVDVVVVDGICGIAGAGSVVEEVPVAITGNELGITGEEGTLAMGILFAVLVRFRFISSTLGRLDTFRLGARLTAQGVPKPSLPLL
jgi:hypothetical protein